MFLLIFIDFRSCEDSENWVQNAVRSQGFVIVTKQSNDVTFGFTSKVFLCCDHGGIPGSKDVEIKKIVHSSWVVRLQCDYQIKRLVWCKIRES
uniref:Uncharacterized protein n=1 Tax=Lactuca sativa TaxID=4236 RepID=A0A9R1V040_LACSA|nr:hypothetical protein LSAT_V11C700366590 [Lactuca sativa]